MNPIPTMQHALVIGSVLGSGSYGVVVTLQDYPDVTSHAATSHTATSHTATSHTATSHTATSHAATSHAATSHAAVNHGTEGDRGVVVKLLFAPHVASLSSAWIEANLPGATLHPMPMGNEPHHESMISSLDFGLVASEVNARAMAPLAFGGYFCMEAAYISPPKAAEHSVCDGVTCTKTHKEDRFPCFALFMRRETPVTHASWAALGLEQRMACVRDWAGQLAHLHANGLMHRDVSVGNLATTPSATGIAGALIDFGLAGPPSTTFSGDMVYAIDFRPPEAKAAGRISTLVCEGDFYALGVTLLQLELGRRCFFEGDANRKMHRLLPAKNATPETVSEMLGSRFGLQPDQMRDCIARLLMRNPSDRQPPAGSYPHQQATGAATGAADNSSINSSNGSSGVVRYNFEACAFTADAYNMHALLTWMMRASEAELHPSSKHAMWALPWERNKRLATALDMFMRAIPKWTLPGGGNDGNDDPGTVNAACMQEAKLVAAACLLLSDAICMLGNGLYFSVETRILADYAHVTPYVLHVAVHKVMILLKGRLMASSRTLPDLFTGYERTHPVIVAGCTEALLRVSADNSDMHALAFGVRAQLGKCNPADHHSETTSSIDGQETQSCGTVSSQGFSGILKRSRKTRDVGQTVEFSKFKLRRVVHAPTVG
jgi:hypothetical protein